MHDKWSEFKVLVDLLIKCNTTRTLRPSVQRELNGILNVKHVGLDFNVFAGAPARIWAEFAKLETLTILFYPYDAITDSDITDGEYSYSSIKLPLNYTTVQVCTRLGRRAEWIYKSAKRAFDAVKIDLPKWNVPKIRVVVRYSGLDNFDEHIHEEEEENVCWDGDDSASLYEEDDMQDDEEGPRAAEEDDTQWYEQASARLAQVVSPEELRRLKHKYFPTRRVELSRADWWTNDGITARRAKMDFLSDSEGEEGQQAAITQLRQYPRWLNNEEGDGEYWGFGPLTISYDEYRNRFEERDALW